MKRVSRACQQCRSKHIKCNGRSPCSRCIAHAELHNITPNEICLYPEPKKRGRPSAGSSHHHSSSSSSVGKKKVNTIMNKGRPASNSSVSSSSSRSESTSSSSSLSTSSSSTTSHPSVPQKNWQKSSSGINAAAAAAVTTAASSATNNESCVYMNYIDIPYFQQVPISQMPVSFADICTQHIINNNLAYTFNNNNNQNHNQHHYQQQPQQQQQQQSRNVLNSNNNRQHPIGTIPSTINLSSCNNHDLNSLLRRSCNYNNSDSSNFNSISNNITPQIIVATTSSSNNINNNNNSYSLIDTLYNNSTNNLKHSNSFISEGNISDASSSDSPYSSLTSTPELLPNWNVSPPSIANSPILPPSAVACSDFPNAAATYYFSTSGGSSSSSSNCINNNNNNNGGGFSFGGFPLMSQLQLGSDSSNTSGFESPLLPDKSELAYIPFTTSIYPSSVFDRNTTTYVKNEVYDPQAVNCTAGWLF